MVFKHPSGIPTKAWYDDYGYLMVKGWKYKAVIALFGAWCIVRKFVAWQYKLPYPTPTTNLTAWPYWMERQALIRKGLNPDEHQNVFDVDP